MSVAVDTTTQSIQYWDAQQQEQGFETVWSLWECEDIDQTIFQEKSHRVFYRFIRGDATMEEIQNDTAWVEVSAFTAGGTVRDFWRAAESCYQQAKQQGDWHKFIEDFDASIENGFELVMGS
jgi:hypothetical protein